MNIPTYQNVHNYFKLNGAHLTKDDLCTVAYSFIKEGEQYEKYIGDFILNWFDEKSFIELNTSGTTGDPKLIQIDKQAMVHSALATGNFFDLGPGDKALHCLPTQYIAGKMMFVRAFILGLELDLVAPSSNPLENNETEYKFCAMVPLQAQNSLKELDAIKILIIGGAKVNDSLQQQLMNLPKTAVYETYAMTETITHIAVKKIGVEAFDLLPHVTIAQDERGCLVIDAPTIASEKVVTNDLVEILNDHQFIWLGRFDNVINSGGIKLIPEKIEEKLQGKINARFFVVGKQDHTLGEKLVLVIEGTEFPIDHAIFSDLGKYEQPKEILFSPKFQETESGKLQRKKTLDSL
ncbi:AMP-binding protein [Flavobacterium sp. '19STA2R22 D10 B1']|uniref:AMP-binding protein n=1 Tax=Flavobacterium aerium TaxID=3037261 RepID=UPI00278C8BF0|nr:AMP-binding protein [Flavobacterium sp. '19STA2R22 D10 B1']